MSSFAGQLAFSCFIALLLVRAGHGYSVEQSSTFHPELSLSKLDNASTDLSSPRKGIDGTDVLRISDVSVRVRLHGSAASKAPYASVADGDLGLGWEGQRCQGCILSDLFEHVQNTNIPHSLDARTRKFSIMTNDTAALLYIGGYDHDTIKGEMVTVPMSGSSYSVNVHSLQVGDELSTVEVLNFHEPSKQGFVSGEVDFSQPCLCIPNNDANRTLRESPYERFLRSKLERGHQFISVAVQGADGQKHLLRMPGDVCVQPCSSSLVLGDPFFRSFVVLYDLSDGNHPRFGFGRRKGQEWGVAGSVGRSEHSIHLASTHDPIVVPVEKKLMKVPGDAGQPAALKYLYLIHASLGTPAKVVTLALDTKRVDLHMFDLDMARKDEKSSRISDFSNLHIESQLHNEGQPLARLRRSSIAEHIETIGNEIKSSFHFHSERTAKRLLLKKTLQKLRRSTDLGDGKRPRSYEDFEVEDEQVGSGQFEGMLGMRKVARVPAMVGINAVLVAAVFTITVRLWSKPRRLDGGKKFLGAEQEELGDAYGSLSSKA